MRLEEYKEEAVEMMKIELQEKNGTGEHARCLRKQGAGAAQNTPNFWGVSSRERKAIAASKWTARSSSIWLAWHFGNAPTNH